jgi:nitroimidazol reductase NimA-like FMN-containing flavoprotein (pyridoxamine 5'-phosphate oxidase superfamily)
MSIIASAEQQLSPSARTTVRRHRDRAASERSELFEVLQDAVVCHLGIIVDAHPVVLPTAFGVDPDGPDPGGTLYLHGSVASRSLRLGPGQDVCVTVTCVDGLVLARSAFHHSMNYRSAVIIGRPRVVTDDEELVRALDLIVDQVVPGRSATLRAHTRKELAATSVLAVPLTEASVKRRSGPPVDDEIDLASGAWAGVLPLRLASGDPVDAPDNEAGQAPWNVRRRAAELR